MSNPVNRASRKSLDEWQSIITSARQSGLTDIEWCQQNGINRWAFSAAIKRLHKKACFIPAPNANRSDIHDLTAPKQDVVQIGIVSDAPAAITSVSKAPISAMPQPAMYLDNSHTVEINKGDISIRISNDVLPEILAQIFKSLRSMP